MTKIEIVNTLSSIMTSLEIKKTGSHYTPSALANFVASNISEASHFEKPKILDPSCGDGSLLKAIKNKIPNALLYGFDLNENAISETKKLGNVQVQKRDFLDYVLSNSENSLFSEEIEKFDIIIANPPYVRTQNLGEKKSQKIAKTFSLSGRVDLYYAFLEGIFKVLKENGIAGIIVSNRFMTVKSGKIVREHLLEHFDILHIWDFGDTKLFSAAVLPAVLLLQKKTNKQNVAPKMTTIYSTQEFAEKKCSNIFESELKNGIVCIEDTNYKIKTGKLDTTNDIWKIQTVESLNWQNIVKKNTFMTFGDIGKVRVGIKTTADKVFVKNNWEEPKPELLKPLITHDDARRFKSLPPSYQVLYPYEMVNNKKSVVDISKYPISFNYLISNKSILEKRAYIQKANRKWYEIWVPQQPENWSKTKLVFPDISEKPVFWISEDEEVIQGNCYWIISDNKSNDDLIWLALGIGNSSFIEEFYDNNFNNKLYSGRRRYMTQYVEKFPLPNPNSQVSKKIISLSKQIYSLIDVKDTNVLQKDLNILVYKAFCLQ